MAPDGDWTTWLILAGRGFGKTRSGAEWVRSQVESGEARRVALVARSAPDTRDVMIEGESGILAISPPWFKPKYEPSKRRLTWPNGAIATTYSADEPALLRGPQHDAAWCDELAAWRYEEAWDQLLLGLRLGTKPKVVITTTPRPTEIIKNLIKDKATVVTRGSTYENKSNLAPTFFTHVVAKYEGTRLGRQELNAEILLDNPGALWNLSQLDALRIRYAPPLRRIVVSVDPAMTSTDESDETGIIIAGIDSEDNGYVLDDISGHYSPDEWARIAVTAYRDYAADRIIGEVNNGGDLVELTIRTVDKSVSYKDVRATRGKYRRAEPVAALYEQKRIFHVGSFPKLEDQMCSYTPTSKQSPDRMDALVWAFTDLILGSQSFAVEPFDTSSFVAGLRDSSTRL